MEAALEDGDPSLVAAALGDIARATLATLSKALKALGLRLTAAQPCLLVRRTTGTPTLRDGGRVALAVAARP